MNNHYIWVKVNTTNISKLLNKLYNSSIYYEDLRIDKTSIYLKIDIYNYNRLKKYLISYKTVIYKDTGIYKYLNIFKSNKIFFISLFISIILLIISNNAYFNIKINTKDELIKNTIISSLEENGIKRVGFKKKYRDIEKIKEKILENNKDTLEWLEIKYNGYDLVILFTKKINKDIKKEDKLCNIVAKTDGKIVSFNIKKGELQTRLNEYVYKGDILVSGIIKNSDEIKDLVCSSGNIYAEVWYKVSLSIPFKKIETKLTNKSKYNVRVTINDNKYKILRSRYKKYREDIYNLYNYKGFKIDLVKETKQVEKEVILTEDKALKEGLKLVDNKMNLKLKEDESIVLKKVLKKTVKDSTMLLDVFVITKENIGKVIKVEEGSISDKSDIRKSS